MNLDNKYTVNYNDSFAHYNFFIVYILGSYFLLGKPNLFNEDACLRTGFKPNVRYMSAFFCYVALTFLLYYFIIKPKRSLLEAFLLGVGVYAVYETTNYALFKNWPLQMVIMDVLWGGFMFFIVAYLQNLL